MESEEDVYYYSSGGEAAEADGGADTEPYYSAVSLPQKSYKILNVEEIKRLQENEISTVSNVLSVPRGVACSLLCRNNWNPSSVYEEWFSAAAEDDGKALKPSGKSGKRKSRTEICNICYEEITIRSVISASCGHSFCSNCWRSYINVSINDGPGCLTLGCPEPGCRAAVGVDMVDSLASGKDKDKYYQFLYRSYVESNKARKWCPGRGCELAVEFGGGEPDTYDVTCGCSFKFCWNCAEESHRPVDCETVAKWIAKNTSEAENTTYILAYTKPCPKCHRAIEKNQGCNDMRCPPPCGFSFCWVCLRPLQNGCTRCNRYRENKEGNKEEKTRLMAKKHLERYTHYFERWASNDRSRKRALIDLGRARDEHVDLLADTYGEAQGQLQFVTDAWEQIVECRRVLKWTYAYGYYLSLTKSGKMEFFEYLQGEAETALERLHHCAEKEMEKFLNGNDCPEQEFRDFRSKLAGLTAVTGNYFENLVTALENNLCEVESSGAQKRRKGSKDKGH